MLAGQAQKEFFLNHALSMVDAILSGSVVETVGTPPANPSQGSSYRIDSPASGEWSGREDQIAIWLSEAWQFVEPSDGMRLFDQSAGRMLHYGSGWKSLDEPTAPSGGSTVDNEARAAISEIIEGLKMIGLFPNLS